MSTNWFNFCTVCTSYQNSSINFVTHVLWWNRIWIPKRKRSMKFVYCPRVKLWRILKWKISSKKFIYYLWRGDSRIYPQTYCQNTTYQTVAGISSRSRAVAIKGVHCILAGVHTTLAKCSYQPTTKHHSPLKNCKEAVDIKSTLHIFESVASLLYRELGFPKQRP